MEHTIIGTSQTGGVSLFWWIVWLFVFPPVLILTALIHFSNREMVYHIQYRKENGKSVIVKMTEKEYNNFIG